LHKAYKIMVEFDNHYYYFLEEELPLNEMQVINETWEKYYHLSKSFDFGASPDEDYAKELMAVYYETFPMCNK